MKGSHRLESFFLWLDQQDDIPFFTKVTLRKKMKNSADMASATGKQSRLDFKRQGEVMMSIRFFDDGSIDVGIPDNAKWYGKTVPFLPPEEKEI